MARWIARAAAVEFAGYALLIVSGARAFALAAANYLPAALFLPVVFVLAGRRGEPAAPLGALGIVTALVASWVQWAQLGLHPAWFNHNALYHTIGALALFMLFRAARGLATPTGRQANADSP